jgi:hypothetical protein
MLLQEIVRFFKGSDVLALEDSVEVMAMIAAADRAIASGKIENVYDF